MGSHSISAGRVVATLTLMVLVGCGGSDLSGYRPLDKAVKSKSGETVPATVQPLNSGDVNETANTVQENDLAAASASDDELPPASALAPINVVDGANVGSLLKVLPGEAVSAIVPSTTETAVKQPTAAAELRKVELLIPEKTFRTDAASKALRVSYDDIDLLKVINMEPVTADAVDQMPPWLKGLSGQRIKIRGFMYPTFETEGIERFVLARDNQICCFGRDPKIYDLVQIDLRAGKTTNYIPATRAFDVVGRLKIEMVAEGGKPYGLYFLEDAEVIDR
ncbi:MAG: hypothetical protein AABP62_04895 [Planctomycetota bacterium]